MRYELRFRFPFAQSDNLIYGQLVLVMIDDDGTEITVASWIATSGLRGHQSLEGVWTRGKGALPPSVQIREDVWADTIPQQKPNLGGLAFQIQPVTIHEKDGDRIRSEAFIHEDTNSPGSLMCPVLPKEEFLRFIPALYGPWVRDRIGSIKLIVEAA